MLPLLPVLLLSLPSALAADPEPVNPFEEPDESELFKLDEELVTVASRYAQTLRKAPSIVTLVTADEIRERGYRTISDVLRGLPGIYVWKTPEGRDISAFRGVISADNNKILLLVDGVPWYEGVYTHAFIDDFMPISHVKQIEVIKGPGSAIYGTNAFAGVINVVTLSGTELDGGQVRWLGGSTGRNDVTMTVGGKARAGGLEVSSSAYLRLLGQLGDGVDVTPRSRNDILGYDPKRGVAGGVRLRVEGLDVQLHRVDYAHTYLMNASDDPFDLLGDDLDDFGLFYHNTYFSTRYTIDVGLDLGITPYVWSHRHDNPGSYFFTTGYTTTEVADGEFETEMGVVTVETEKDTRRWGTGFDVEGRPGLDHVTVAGLGVETVATVDRPDPSDPGSIIPGVIDIEYVDFSREGEPSGFEASGQLTNIFAYAQHTWTVLPELEIAAGGRFDKRIPVRADDDPTQAMYVPSAIPRVALLFVPNESVTWKLLYGGAFRAPNIREVLVSAAWDEDEQRYEWSNGSPDLYPERIQTAETELSWVLNPPLEMRIAGSYSRIIDEIDKTNPRNEYENLPGHLQIMGGEAELSADYGLVDFSAAYVLTDARYSADAGRYAGRVQYEFPPHMGKGFVRVRPTDALSATLYGELYSYRPRIEWATDTGLDDGDWVSLLHLGVRVTDIGKDDRFELTAAVRNLTGTRWGTGVYRDDANVLSGGEPKYPGEFEGEERAVIIGIETLL